MMRLFTVLACVACATWSGCGFRGSHADAVLHNGVVLTLDAASTEAQAIAVRNGRIVTASLGERAGRGRESERPPPASPFMSKSIPASPAMNAAKAPRQRAQFISIGDNRGWSKARRLSRDFKGAERVQGGVHQKAFKHFRIPL